MTSDKTFGLGSWRDKVTPAAGSVVAAVAILILIGWQGGATILAGWGPGLATMKPITAACFLAAGAVLALDGRIPHRAVHGLGWLVSALGAFAIAQDANGVCALALGLASTSRHPAGSWISTFQHVHVDGSRIHARWRCISAASRSTGANHRLARGRNCCGRSAGLRVRERGTLLPAGFRIRSRYRRHFAC